MSRTIGQMSATGAIQLNGVIDRSFYYRYKSNGDIRGPLEARLANRSILPSNELRKLHHKVLIIDASHPDPADQSVVVTGSYNFPKNAEVNNDENLLSIYSDRLSDQYYQDFMGVMSRSKGDTDPPPIDTRNGIIHKKTEDPGRFNIEIVPGFSYGVWLLGIELLRFCQESDSADYFAKEAREYLDEN